MFIDLAESGLGSFPFRVIAGTHRCVGARWLLQRRRCGSVDQVSNGTRLFDIRIPALLDTSITFHPLNQLQVVEMSISSSAGSHGSYL
jgi:hypothetical protein